MTEATNSSFASLSPSLLARKGGAKPAMRPQIAPLPTPAQENAMPASLEDLGWNDMGEDDVSAPAPAPLPLTPAPTSPEAKAEEEANAAQDETAKAPGSPALDQREQLEQRLSEPKKVAEQKTAPAPNAKSMNKAKGGVRSPAKRRANGSALANGRKAAFTLRLDAQRHLKLRLASTIHNRSAQQIVTEALDKLLSDTPELDALAAQVSKR